MAKKSAFDAESIARDAVTQIRNGLDAANVRNAEMGIPVWNWKSEDGWRHVALMREILGLSEAEFLASTFANLQLKCEALAYRERIKAKAYLAAISPLNETLAALGSSNAERLPPGDTRSNGTAGGATPGDIPEVRGDTEAETSVGTRDIGQADVVPLVKPDAPVTATKLLVGWHEICHAVGRPNDASFRKLIRRLSDTYDGPIHITGKGKQPEPVDRDRLVSWWNGLAERQQNAAELDEELAANVEGSVGDGASYEHGRSGEVVPAIGGSVKKRRLS